MGRWVMSRLGLEKSNEAGALNNINGHLTMEMVSNEMQ